MAIRKKSMGLFQALSDKKSMNALTQGKPAGSFKEYLQEKGELPFKEEDDVTVGLRARRILGMRLETLLAVALAFGITNVISFTLGAWNSDAAAPAEVRVKAQSRETRKPDVNIAEKPLPKAIPARFEIPPARQDGGKPNPAVEDRNEMQEPQAPVEEAKYTIRTITLDSGMKDRAADLEKFFKEKGFSSVRVRQAGDKLVVEVGGYASINSAEAREALGKVRSLNHKYDSFRDAFFVKK